MLITCTPEELRIGDKIGPWTVTGLPFASCSYYELALAKEPSHHTTEAIQALIDYHKGVEREEKWEATGEVFKIKGPSEIKGRTNTIWLNVSPGPGTYRYIEERLVTE